jgi:hypothetical protein
MSYKLTPEQRTTYVLRNVLDLSYTEIADILETPMTSVKSRLKRIKNNFESFFSDNCQWLCTDGRSRVDKYTCSCEKKIGIALALKPELIKKVKQAALEHDASSAGKNPDCIRFQGCILSAFRPWYYLVQHSSIERIG